MPEGQTENPFIPEKKTERGVVTYLFTIILGRWKDQKYEQKHTIVEISEAPELVHGIELG